MIKTIKKIIKSQMNPQAHKELVNRYKQIKYNFIQPNPLEIILDISASCNAACPFCPRIFMDQDRSKGYMSLEKYKFSLEEAARHNINRLRLYSTAEPTLHPDFSEMIAIAKQMEFYVSVSTNASMMHKHMDALLQIDQIQFSIEGWDKESYEFYRQPLKFDKVYENICAFDRLCATAEIKPARQINLLLTKETNMALFIETWGDLCDDIFIHFMFPSSVFENGKIAPKVPLKIQDKLYNFTTKTGKKFCHYPFEVVTVAFDGKISLCCDDFSSSFSLGNIDDGIDSIYHQDELKRVRNQFYTQQLDMCAQCNIFLQPHLEDIEKVKKQLSMISSAKARIIFDY